jgi:hypothetical protein
MKARRERKELRRFGATLAAGVVSVALWGAWREAWHPTLWRLLLLGGGAVLALTSWLVPSLLRWPRRAWSALGRTVGRVSNAGVLIVFFVIVIVPVGAVARLAGADLLRLRRRPPGQSYWRAREPDGRGGERYTHPF